MACRKGVTTERSLENLEASPFELVNLVPLRSSTLNLEFSNIQPRKHRPPDRRWLIYKGLLQEESHGGIMTVNMDLDALVFIPMTLRCGIHYEPMPTSDQ